MVLIYLWFVYAPQCLADRKCLITGAAYTYHYSLAHLVSCCSVAPTLPFIPPARLQALYPRCFPLLCPLLMLSPKSSILPSPDTKPSMSLYQFADMSYSTGSIPPFSQKNVFQGSSLAFHVEIKQFIQFILKPCSFLEYDLIITG